MQQPGYSPPQYVTVEHMQQKIYTTRLYAFGIGLALVIVAFISGYFINNMIWHNWFQSNCIAYPFLLIDSRTHVACTISTP